MSTGWCPFATRIEIPTGNYREGRAGYQPYAVVDHVSDGVVGNDISWFRNPKSGVSAHFEIAKTGTIFQFVSINDTAYANGATYQGNGLWKDPAGNIVRPPWKKLESYHANPNFITISIEHEGKPGDVWTQAMTDADTRLLQWIRAETGIVFRPLDTLIGHCHIGPIHRANCPGPHVDYAAQAARGNAAANPFGGWGSRQPLDPAAYGFAVPQFWLKNQWLGACVAREDYTHSDNYSITRFQHGGIIYDKPNDEVVAVRMESIP